MDSLFVWMVWGYTVGKHGKVPSKVISDETNVVCVLNILIMSYKSRLI